MDGSFCVKITEHTLEQIYELAPEYVLANKVERCLNLE
jgi:hypothetical protein